MSILIKGMKMPKECRDCPMETYYINCGDTRCRATNKILAEDYKTIPFDGRPDFCPLVEVPVPHGRLIDAETKIEAQYYDEEYEEWTMQTFTVEEIISVADNEVSTVIEAEGTE